MLTETEITAWMDRHSPEETASMAALWRLAQRGPRVAGERPLPLRYAVAQRVVEALGGSR